MDINVLCNQLTLVCSVCLFNPKPEGLNDDRLTVIGGAMICVDHCKEWVDLEKKELKRKNMKRRADLLNEMGVTPKKEY